MSNTDAPVSEPADPSVVPQVSRGEDMEELNRAQRERPREQVGAAYGHGAVRRTTSDELDPHRDWTVQSGRPFPQEDRGRTTRFHPSELPDPQKAVDAGLLPQVLPPMLIDDTHITQPPSENVPLDHPLRGANPDPGYEAWKQTTPDVGLEQAEAQRRLTGSWETRDGHAPEADADAELPEVASEYDRANARAEALDSEREDDDNEGPEGNVGGGAEAPAGSTEPETNEGGSVTV